ncbi:GNAT family N-acetyltransferase [Elioraea rosea]|uniref:GNAT family N-acetyltransferase n=1 Tax=Elioraea rosea TaxID=2492390 RepID=UPI001183D9CF|nr:GNAT family N-acetyltransferase [Elioraea rosea]
MDGDTLKVETLTGPALLPHLKDLARLRIAVFREYPYLYEGDPAYEASYLARYTRDGGAVVLVRDGAEVVGAATCLPLAAEADMIRAPFHDHGLDCERFFYFGESVLLPEYRGRGIGHAFFDAREKHAASWTGTTHACFCAVVRPEGDARRPQGYRPLDGFWRRRGYVPYPRLVCHMAWREIGGEAECRHDLSFWIRSLGDAPLP